MAGFMDSFKAAKGGLPMPAKKPGMEIAIGVGKPPMGDAQTEGDHQEPDGDETLNEGERTAAHAAMSAVQSGDPVVFGRALKAFIASAGAADDADEDDSDKGGSPMPQMMPGK